MEWLVVAAGKKQTVRQNDIIFVEFEARGKKTKKLAPIFLEVYILPYPMPFARCAPAAAAILFPNVLRASCFPSDNVSKIPLACFFE